MTGNKDFKRVVRARMQKTGESYTAARAVLVRKPSRNTPAPPPSPDYAGLADMADATIAAKTGRDWAAWVAALDSHDAHTRSHTEIARLIYETYEIPGWWAQAVAVGYERIKGLREIGQRRDGAYEASRSKTIGVPVATVFKAFTDARTRRKWLAEPKLEVRSATPDKSVRLTWADGTSVAVWLTAKGSDKVSVAVTHARLETKEDVACRKEYWGERLNALADFLTPGNAKRSAVRSGKRIDQAGPGAGGRKRRERTD